MPAVEERGATDDEVSMYYCRYCGWTGSAENCLIEICWDEDEEAVEYLCPRDWFRLLLESR